MTIRYEWDIETVAADEHEDVLDHDHRDRLSEFGVEELIFAILQQPGPDSTGDTFLGWCWCVIGSTTAAWFAGRGLT